MTVSSPLPSSLVSRLRSMLGWLRELLSIRVAILFAVALVAAIAFAGIAEEVHEGGTDRFDEAASRLVNRLDSPAMDVAMRIASDLGSVVGLVIAVALTMAWAVRRGHTRAAVVLAIHAVFCEALNSILKLVFARDRPTMFDKIDLPSTYSFPSGHSMVSVAVYGAIAAIVIELVPRARWPVIIGAVVLVLSIGLSRVYLGAHWAMDVAAGYAAAVPPLMATLFILNRFRIRNRGTELA